MILHTYQTQIVRARYVAKQKVTKIRNDFITAEFGREAKNFINHSGTRKRRPVAKSNMFSNEHNNHFHSKDQ